MTAIFFRFLLTILWELVILVQEFYMLKSNIAGFCVTSFLCSLNFLLFHRIEYPKRCLWKKMKFFYGSVFAIWHYLQKARYRPCDLDHWPMMVNVFQWIEYNHISILYKFQIDISSNSREIKYQNIGRTHRHTHRHTHRQTDRVKTIPRNPIRGEVNIGRTHRQTQTQTDRVKTIPRNPSGALCVLGINDNKLELNM